MWWPVAALIKCAWSLGESLQGYLVPKKHHPFGPYSSPIKGPMVVLGGWVFLMSEVRRSEEARLHTMLLSRDEYLIAEQPAPAPHLAHLEGCAALLFLSKNRASARASLPPTSPQVQGYLAHKKQRPPRTLPQAYA